MDGRARTGKAAGERDGNLIIEILITSLFKNYICFDVIFRP